MSKLVLYTKDECPACTNTKTFLTKNSIDFEEFKIGDNIVTGKQIGRAHV